MIENNSEELLEKVEGSCETAAEAEQTEKTQAEALEEKISRLEAEIKEKDDRYLRMAAEYDNFRRRSREEREALYQESVKDTVKELLPIIDTLERAVQFDDGEKVKEGLVMTLKATAGALEKLGVKSFGEVGDSFDPNIHNAVMHIEDDTLGEGEIVEVFQKGYEKNGHIIRFAMVKSAN